MALSEGLIPMSLFGSHYEGRDGKPLAVSTKIVATDGSGNFENIQSAIDDLPAGGGVVYIKEGTYEVSTMISIRNDNTAITGAGKGTELKFTGGGSRIIDLSGRSGCLVSAMHLNGNAQAVAGIRLRNSCTECIIENLWITNMLANGAGVILEGDSEIIVSKCNICAVSSGEGIYAWNCSHSRILGNYCHDNDNGIQFEGNSDKNILLGNVTENSGTSGIDIKAATCDKNIVVANASINDTAAITDAGTNTDLGHNVS
jgi:parallel beta-helix repeat protein